MSAESRLNRLYPALSAKERGVLVLRAYKAHEPPNRLIYATCPSPQGAAFNRYIRLMNAVNSELAIALIMIREQVDKTGIKYAWFVTTLLWGMETQFLGELVLEQTKNRRLRKDVRRLMARAPGDFTVPIDLAVPPTGAEIFETGFGGEFVKALLLGIKESLLQHWAELLAIEIAVREVAEEFDEEDPLQPEVRQLLADGLQSCVKLRDDLARYTAIEQPEPDDDTIEQVRLLIETAAAPAKTW